MGRKNSFILKIYEYIFLNKLNFQVCAMIEVKFLSVSQPQPYTIEGFFVANLKLYRTVFMLWKNSSWVAKYSGFSANCFSIFSRFLAFCAENIKFRIFSACFTLQKHKFHLLNSINAFCLCQITNYANYYRENFKNIEPKLNIYSNHLYINAELWEMVHSERCELFCANL